MARKPHCRNIESPKGFTLNARDMKEVTAHILLSSTPLDKKQRQSEHAHVEQIKAENVDVLTHKKHK